MRPFVADVDECALEVHKCSDNAVCSDTEGDYNCTCVDGYEGNGINCTSKPHRLVFVSSCDTYPYRLFVS